MDSPKDNEPDRDRRQLRRRAKAKHRLRIGQKQAAYQNGAAYQDELALHAYQPVNIRQGRRVLAAWLARSDEHAGDCLLLDLWPDGHDVGLRIVATLEKGLASLRVSRWWENAGAAFGTTMGCALKLLAELIGRNPAIKHSRCDHDGRLYLIIREEELNYGPDAPNDGSPQPPPGPDRRPGDDGPSIADFRL